MERSVHLHAVLKVYIDLEVENVLEDSCGLMRGSVVKRIVAKTIGMVLVWGRPGSQQLGEELWIVRAGCVEVSLVCGGRSWVSNGVELEREMQ